MKQLAIFGSTGSIGTQTLDIVRRNPDLYRAAYLTSNGNTELLAKQIDEFHPDAVVICDPCAASVARKVFGSETTILEGADELSRVAALPDVDIVVAAVVGFSGLRLTIEAVRAGKRVALANKETMVVAGELITRLSRENGAEIIPVDSEHSAIFQCLVGEQSADIESVILTASGGPFRTLPRAEFSSITVERALQHPNWQMGPKVTIDSATLMNKGLELIEARWLFDVAPKQLDVVVHPESIIHSMVQFVDGSVKAQLGVPDMRLPIQYALGYPDRLANDFERLDLTTVGRLTFEMPDYQRFQCLQLAVDALARGGTAPAVLNAANEIAVAAFLANQIAFTEIPVMIARALEAASIIDDPSFEAIVNADASTRELVGSYFERVAA